MRSLTQPAAAAVRARSQRWPSCGGSAMGTSTDPRFCPIPQTFCEATLDIIGHDGKTLQLEDLCLCQSLPRLHHGLDPPARDAQGIRSAPLPQHLGGGFSQVRSQTLKSIRVPLTLNLNLPPMPCGNAPVPEPPNPGMRGEILPSLRPRQPWKGAPSGSLRRGGTEGRH